MTEACKKHKMTEEEFLRPQTRQETRKPLTECRQKHRKAFENNDKQRKSKLDIEMKNAETTGNEKIMLKVRNKRKSMATKNMHERNHKLKDRHGESSGVTKLLMPRDKNMHPKKLDKLPTEEQEGQ